MRLTGSPGVTVHPGYIHAGVAQRLVHHLKYRAVQAAAASMAALLVPVLPPATAFIPVPRSAGRRLRYGVDAADELAAGLSRLTGVPVVRTLSTPPYHRSHTGKTRAARLPPVFRKTFDAPDGSVLVDDVITGGSTLAAAGVASGVLTALTFSSAASGPQSD